MLEITDICNTIIIVLFSYISSMTEQRDFSFDEQKQVMKNLRTSSRIDQLVSRVPRYSLYTKDCFLTRRTDLLLQITYVLQALSRCLDATRRSVTPHYLKWMARTHIIVPLQ